MEIADPKVIIHYIDERGQPERAIFDFRNQVPLRIFVKAKNDQFDERETEIRIWRRSHKEDVGMSVAGTEKSHDIVLDTALFQRLITEYTIKRLDRGEGK